MEREERLEATLADRYRSVRLIGSGGMATAHRRRGMAYPSPAIAIRALRLTGFLLFLPALITCDSSATGLEEPKVGVGGGTVSLAEGSVTLSIPPEALSTEVTFSATPTSIVPASDLLVPGSTFEIGPPETTFDHLATLTLVYDPASLPSGVQESELRLYKAVGSHWDLLANASVDVDKHTVSGRIESLGRFGVLGLPVTTLEVSLSRYTLATGETKQLTAAGRGPFGGYFSERRVTWTSGDEAVATVDSSGLVTAVGAGWATVTATVESRSSSVGIRVYDCSAQSEIPATECQALISVYDALTNGDWRYKDGYRDNWVDSLNPCDWRGVTCADGSVSVFSIPNRQFGGSIPFSIGDLSNLTQLELWSNRLSGPIPYSIGTLTKLQSLSLRSNELTGPIPPELGNLSNLTILELGWNQLSGPVPPELGNLSNLRTLWLQANQLFGSIPPSLADLSELTDLSLSFNQLTGSIPRELGALSNLTRLGVGRNLLTGPIPAEIGNLTELEGLYLEENQLSGSIPAEIGDLTKLEGLHLQENRLSGSIPLVVAQLGGQIQARFANSQDCVFVPPGNTGLSMPDTQEFRDADLNGDGKICGVSIGS